MTPISDQELRDLVKQNGLQIKELREGLLLEQITP